MEEDDELLATHENTRKPTRRETQRADDRVHSFSGVVLDSLFAFGPNRVGFWLCVQAARCCKPRGCKLDVINHRVVIWAGGYSHAQPQ